MTTMTGEAEVSGVLVLDLRDVPSGDPSDQVREMLNGYRHRDARRVLILDDAVAAVDNYAVYAAVRASRLVHRVLCVLVGEPVGREHGQALRTTPVFDTGDSAVLWVGDTDGIEWRVALDAVAAPTGRSDLPGPADVDRPPDQGLAELIAVLRTPDVFDEVIKAMDRVPTRTASPGYRTAETAVDQIALINAETAALTRLAGPDLSAGDVPDLAADTVDFDEADPDPDTGPDTNPDPDTDLDTGADPDTGAVAAAVQVLLGRADGRAVGTPRPLRPGSPMDALYRACRDRITELDAATVQLARPGRLLQYGPGVPDGHAAAVAAVAAGGALVDFRDAVAAELAATAGRTGLSPTARERLRRQGLQLTVPDTDLVGAAVARLRRGTRAALDRHHPLSSLAQWLRDVADRSAPHGSSGYLDQLGRACPDRVTDDLVRPTPPRLAPLTGWMAVAVVLCCALAGAGGRIGWVTGPLVALGWVAGTSRALTLLPRARFPSGHRADGAAKTPGRGGTSGTGVLGTQFLLASGGAATGIVAGAALGLPDTLAPAAVLSAGCLWLLLAEWWHESVRRWADGIGVAGARAAADAVHELICRAAAADWALSDVRKSVSDLAGTAAKALLQTGRTLIGRATERASRAGVRLDSYEHPTSGSPADLTGELTEVCYADLVDLVWAAMDDAFWDGLRGAAPDDASQGRLNGRVAALLTGYEQQLDRCGPQERPTFPTRTDNRRDRLTRLLWRDNPTAAEVLAVGPDDPMRQLCLADDLGFLERTGRAVPLVRFAPQVARSVLGGGVDEADLCWTSSGHRTGVVRLVPLRAGTIESGWPAAGPGSPTKAR